MNRSTHALRAAALAGAVALVLTACSGRRSAGMTRPRDRVTPLIIGSLLPQTGSLAFLGPPEIAGVNLAIEEINEAGGVAGQDVKIEHADSSDADNAEVATQSVTGPHEQGRPGHHRCGLLGRDAQRRRRHHGCRTSCRSRRRTRPRTCPAQDPFYFRTAPLGHPSRAARSATSSSSDGVQNVGILVFNDDYGTSLRDVVKDIVEDAGGTLTYGDEGEEFDPKAHDFSRPVTAVLADEPRRHRHHRVRADQADRPRARAARATTCRRSTSSTATCPTTAERLRRRARSRARRARSRAPTRTTSSRPACSRSTRTSQTSPTRPESYDATILAALAAVKGGATDGTDHPGEPGGGLRRDGGEACTTSRSASTLLEDGEDINYQAVSGVGPFNDDNDPSSAFIGIYKYGADNKYTCDKAEVGEV